MPNYIPLQPSQHKEAGFQRAQTVAHGSTDQFSPVLLEELAHLVPVIPLCFIKSRSDNARFELVAFQGLEEGLNLFVDPKTQKWLTPYMPAEYRSYPFSVGKDMKSGKKILCFDLDSGLLLERPSTNDMRFFTQDGQLSQFLKDTMAFMEQCSVSGKRTQTAVDMLAELDLLVDWPVKLTRLGQETAVEGVYRIDPARLQALDAESLKRLHDVHGTQIAYAQLFSERQLTTLAKLDSYHLSGASKAPSIDPLDEIWTPDDGDISFDLDS